MAEIKDPENTLVITLKDGDVVIEMLPDVAPKHVEQIKTLARDGEYDNVAFHRVIEGFMAQTGDVEHGDMEDGFNIAEPERALLPNRIFLPSSRRYRSIGALAEWRGRRTRTAAIRSSSSCSRRGIS